jgi:hypothetical protein
MDFRELAAKETSDLAVRLTKAAQTAADLAAKRAGDEAQKVADGLRGELQAVVKQKMALAASLKEAQAQSDSLRGELKSAVDRGETASRQLAEARKANEALEQSRDQVVAARDEHARARTGLEADLRTVREALEGANRNLAATNQQLEKAVVERAASEEAASVVHSHAEASEAKLAAVTDLFKQSQARVKVLERAQEDHDRMVKELKARPAATASAPAAASASAAAGSTAAIDELLSSFQALGAATTIADVLTTFVEQLAAQFPRVALFRVKKSHLQGEHQIGFDLKTDIAKVVMPLGMDSLLSRAASSGQIERLGASELKDSSRAPFSGSPNCALAIPIVVLGDTLGIIYADDAGAPKGKQGDAADLTGQRIAEAMQHHAVALLLRMANELKMRAELQTYARSLLHELQQMYLADEQSGKQGDELEARLKGNLDYARSIFESRVALEGADSAALLDDEVASLVEAEAETPFGRDLASASGQPEPSARKQNAAEAS